MNLVQVPILLNLVSNDSIRRICRRSSSTNNSKRVKQDACRLVKKIFTQILVSIKRSPGSSGLECRSTSWSSDCSSSFCTLKRSVRAKNVGIRMANKQWNRQSKLGSLWINDVYSIHCIRMRIPKEFASCRNRNKYCAVSIWLSHGIFFSFGCHSKAPPASCRMRLMNSGLFSARHPKVLNSS